VVVSARARRASLTVEPGRGVVVTIPRRFPASSVPEFVEKNRLWIEKTLSTQWAQTPHAYRQWPPRTLLLHGIGLNITLSYAQNPSPDVPPTAPAEQRWLLESLPDDRPSVVKEISQKLKTLARVSLTQRVAAFSELHSLRYKRLVIRGQKTRWGSYSSSGTLSLNYKLLFLNKSLVDYVLLHELAHSVYLDHSPAFWQLLVSLDVNARKHDKLLGQMGHQVPPWLINPPLDSAGT